MVKKILYLCHDGDLYGSQHSLLLLLKHMPKTFDDEAVEYHVSLARSGPFEARLKAEAPQVHLHHHDRVQWVKHDPRAFWQRIGDLFTVTLGALPRVWRLCRWMKAEGFDWVHTNSVVSLEGAMAAKCAGIPHIWHVRELLMELSPKFQPVLGRALTRKVIDWLSDRVICISYSVQAMFCPLKSFSEVRYPVIPNAIDDDLLNRPLLAAELHSPTALLRLGYVGRLSEGKGFHILLEALGLLLGLLPGSVSTSANLTLTVAGRFVDDAYETRVLKQVQDLGLTDRIQWLGFQSDLAQTFARMDLLVVPSLAEPFGRVVIEAMAYGVPVLASRSGGIPEIIPNTPIVNTPGDTPAGFLFEANQPQDLARVLQDVVHQLKERPAFLNDVAQAAKTHVQLRYSIHPQVKAIWECYQDLI